MLNPGLKVVLDFTSAVSLLTFKDTDSRNAQSIFHRNIAANLYETQMPGDYFHIRYMALLKQKNL